MNVDPTTGVYLNNNKFTINITNGALYATKHLISLQTPFYMTSIIAIASDHQAASLCQTPSAHNHHNQQFAGDKTA
jgi:hypothetical protein